LNFYHAQNIYRRAVLSIEWHTIGLLLQPYYRFCVCDISRKVLSDIKLFQKNEVCSIIRQYFKAPFETPYVPYAYWNKIDYFLGRFCTFDNDFFARLSYLLIRNELTQKILLIKELRLASPDGKWPETIPGIEKSLCSEYRWIYRIKPDGTMCISMNLTPLSCEWAFPFHICLPLSFCQE
jgi:hypothetical protein